LAVRGKSVGISSFCVNGLAQTIDRPEKLVNDNWEAMSSERRIQTSRANGAKSQGPKTPEGKLRSARNRLHDVLARTIVLDDEHAAFTALLDAFESEL
jgi:hypothetical protein